MARCDTCGNDYDYSFVVVRGTEHYTFDTFECAIHKLAPVCGHCGVRIVGHGIESRSPAGLHAAMYCCAHCARSAGESGAVDRLQG